MGAGAAASRLRPGAALNYRSKCADGGSRLPTCYAHGERAACHGAVMDEVAHLAAGVSNWDPGSWVNPPLVRMAAALPALAAGADTVPMSISISPTNLYRFSPLSLMASPAVTMLATRRAAASQR